MRISLAIAVATCLAALAGCANNTEPIVVTEPATQQQRNFELVWQSSMDVLEDYYFLIDRQDRREGVITTYPMTGKQWFELWRKDGVTRYDVAESSLQTIYRMVQVDIKPTDEDPSRFRAVVTSRILRSDKPSREAVGASGIHARFLSPDQARSAERVLREYEQAERRDTVVTKLGRDRGLEQRISAQIDKMVGNQQATGTK